jgi:uncharacterized RDD family membrane protein YckC
MMVRDTALRVQTPEGIEYSLYPAGFPIRACAYGIDAAFQWMILVVLIIVNGIVLENLMGFWFVLLVRFVLDWFYHVFWEVFFRGQSPGKKFLGIRVVRSDGSPVDPGSSLLRNLLRFVDNFEGLFIVGFISMIASPAFRRVGDWTAGTLVIHTWQSQAPERREPMAWLAGISPVVPGRPLSYKEKQGILMFARRYPLLGPARAGEIAASMAAVLRDPSDTTADDSARYLLGIARALETS